MRISDFIPLPPAAPAPAPARASNGAQPSAANWFDADAIGGDVRIAGDVGLASRGLTVEQHAARVLVHLRGDADRSI